MCCIAAKAHVHAANQRRGDDAPMHNGHSAKDGRDRQRNTERGNDKDSTDKARSDRANRDQSDRGPRPSYLDDVKSAKSQMRRPSDAASSLSWR